ncbi:drebrin-like [Pezoporus flaviventris]|uniref:drebrin-like n=1 Tax=Pezoporus flaviventris TaxID=889875 RepID=UPI002AB26D45|nr:drebrin-like [Pezoporus flaviventris]
MAAPGLERHRLALLAAREDVGNPRAGTDWAVFGYEKHHDLKLLDSGAGGPDELAGRFSAGSIMYGLCRVPEPGTGAPRVVLISWVGEKVPEAQREACAGHLPVLRGFFREASAVLSARRPEEVTREGLSRALAQVEPPGAPVTRRVPPPDTQELVGTNYRKTNPALELRRTQRDSFWAQAEREEQQRRDEERRRALEEQQRWERLRRLQERREAAERERRCQDKEREIQEQRKAQALLEAEERRKEKERWEQQQREHEEAMRDRGRSSESIGKAAEAAVLVSQRPQNPRDFFRQRERSGSTAGAPDPAGPPRPGARRPFLRYQRSLTETAFIFRRPEPAAPQPREPGGRPQAPPAPAGTGSPPGTPSNPAGSPPSATLGTPTMGTGTPPGATPGTPPSPMGTGIPQSVTPGTPVSPIGTGTPPSASLGPPPSPARAGSPHATSPVGTGTPPAATSGTPTVGTGTPPTATTGTPPSPIGTRTPPSATLGTPISPIGTGTPPSAALGTLTSPIEGGNPPSPTMGNPPSPIGAAAGSPPLPSPPPAESPPPDTCPLPSPPAWGSPEGLEEGGLSPRGGYPVPAPPRCGPSPPHLPPGPQPGPVGPEPPRRDSGQNGIGGELWAAPWERDPPPPEGDEPSDSSIRTKDKPGFALLLTHPQLLGGSSAPPTEEELSPHAV